MEKKEKSKRKISSILIIILTIALLIFIGLDIYRKVQITNLSEDEMIHVTDSFVEYSSSNNEFRIICKNEEYRISRIMIDKEQINSIKEDDELYLGLYNDEIVITIKVNGNDLITLNESRVNYQENIKILSIVFSVIFASILFLYLAVPKIVDKVLDKKNKKHLQKEIETTKIENINKKVYESIISSIKKDNGRYYSDAFDILDNNELIPTFTRAMLDYIDENEIYMLYDNNPDDDSMAYILFKLGDKLSIEVLFKNEEGYYEVSDELHWYFPCGTATDDESKKYKYAINYFIESNYDIVKEGD